jgi:hypothetical protein
MRQVAFSAVPGTCLRTRLAHKDFSCSAFINSDCSPRLYSLRASEAACFSVALPSDAAAS